MQQNYQNVLVPTTAADVGPGNPTFAEWNDVSNVLVDDSNYTWLGIFSGGQNGDTLEVGGFAHNLPPGAVIDGIALNVRGLNVGCYGSLSIGISGANSVDVDTLNKTYGGSTDLWGLSEITNADLDDLQVSVDLSDVSGGDGVAHIEYLDIAVYFHIDLGVSETDVPTRIDYKVYSRDGNYLGLLPNVTSKLSFPEDINSAGTSIAIVCGKYVNNEVTVSPLLTEAGEEITTESDLPILTTSTDLMVTTGDSPDEAIFKNSNRVQAWMYNKYYPNGKLMFSGQINAVSFKYGGGDATVKLQVYSDGLDMNNYIARGYPFANTNDVQQLEYDGYYTITTYSFGGWQRYGQTWKVGASVDNIAEIVTLLQGTATVTLSIYDAVNGNFLTSITKNINNGSPESVYWGLPQLLDITPGSTPFFALSVAAGQSIKAYRKSTSVYSDGSAYLSSYSGGSGGGSWALSTGDFFFATKWGEPTTTATYTSDDPTTEMASGILQDYNDRGGMIRERDFDATGLSLTYTFVVAFIYDAIKKILELCPTGFYAYVDVGTAEIDIKQTSTTPDFTVVRGRHINELNISLTIEQVKNYLLLTGGDTGGGTNLFRDYKDSSSSAYYGLRTVPKTDNRVTNSTTADAIGDTFIEENADEQQQTSLTVLNENIDITLLTPGKTIGFKNFGNFIDDLVLQIVRREINCNDGTSILTLGRLPVRMNDQIEWINRQLLNEQTIDNPSAPS